VTRLLAAAIVVIAAVTLSAAVASARTEKLAVTIAIPSQALPGPNDPGRCVAAAFAVFKHVEDASDWTLFYHDGYYDRDFKKTISPPFSDVFHDGAATFIAPRGSHQVALAGSSVGSGCGDAVAGLSNRFTKARVEVTVDQASIRGKVVDADGGPIVEKVAITAKGRRTLHATTGPDGRYEIPVPAKAVGKYKVTPKARDVTFLPGSRQVHVRKGKVAQAHFRARGGCRVRASTVNPKDGLYMDDTPGVARTIQLNYSCRSRQVIAKFAPTVTASCTGEGYLAQGIAKYSLRMSVDGDGRFSQSEKAPKSQGIRWSGQFTGAESARVSFVMPACQYLGRADNLRLVNEGPFQF
jgi:hypothetical protein